MQTRKVGDEGLESFAFDAVKQVVLDATRNNVVSHVVLDRTLQQTIERLGERWEELSEEERLVLNLFVEEETTPTSAVSPNV